MENGMILLNGTLVISERPRLHPSLEMQSKTNFLSNNSLEFMLLGYGSLNNQIC